MNEEISLREVIEIILRYKWIIIICTVFCMIVAAIFSFFIVAPTYETYSIVRMQSTAAGDGKTQTDIKQFQESMKSSSTLHSLIEKNELDRNKYSVNSIRNMFRLEAVKDSDIIKIIVTGKDPKEISMIANMLAFELGVRIEITDRTKDVVEAQKRLLALEDQIEIAKTRLEESQKLLEKTPEKLITTQALANNDLLREIEQEQSNSSTVDAARLQMQSETINPLYTDLQAKVAQQTIELNALLVEAQTNQNIIDTSLSRINEIETKPVNDRLELNKSVRILDGTNAIFINPSIEPESPIGPKKMLNIAIAAVVGGIVSLLYAFLRHYMRQTSNQTTGSGVDV